MDDLAGTYTLNDAQGNCAYVAYYGWNYFGTEADGKEGEPEFSEQYINNISVTTDGKYLYFRNFLNIEFYAEVDLDAMTVTIPPQTVYSPTGYEWLMCKSENSMFGSDRSFTDEDAQPIVMQIRDDGDFSTITPIDGATTAHYDYIAFWGWGANYGYLRGTFHKTASYEPTAETAAILGTYTCKNFSGSWYYLWSDDDTDEDEHTFDVATGDGIDEIVGATSGPYNVYINSLGGNDVEMRGLWWGELAITGSYDASTKTITFPLQEVWGGYTLCNSSLCDLEVPQETDVVPATATINDDASITMHYTVEYANSPYIYVSQSLNKLNSGVQNVAIDADAAAPAEYFNLQGMRVNPSQKGVYIVRQGGKVTKQLLK